MLNITNSFNMTSRNITVKNEKFKFQQIHILLASRSNKSAKNNLMYNFKLF